MQQGHKAVEILRVIATMTAKGEAITLSHDWGFGSTTVELGGGHTHVGDDCGTDDERLAAFIDGLYSLLVLGRWLSILADAR